MPQFLSTLDPDFESRFAALLDAKREDAPDVDAMVSGIIADVRDRGDAAVIELTEKFDRQRLTPETLAFSSDEIEAECARVPSEEREALVLAAERIRAYHRRQMPEDASWTDDAGAKLGWRWTPVASAGLYVPGGLASYPSSVLMNAIPAQVAGVERLVITAPTPDGSCKPAGPAGGETRRASRRSTGSAVRRRLRRWPMARRRSIPLTRSPAPATLM